MITVLICEPIPDQRRGPWIMAVVSNVTADQTDVITERIAGSQTGEVVLNRRVSTDTETQGYLRRLATWIAQGGHR